MRHICVHCSAPYGVGINKPQKGFCSECWEWHLATTVLNNQETRLQQRRERNAHVK